MAGPEYTHGDLAAVCDQYFFEILAHVLFLLILQVLGAAVPFLRGRAEHSVLFFYSEYTPEKLWFATLFMHFI